MGSKSPFSYADSFNIRTVFNNFLYEYIYILTDSYPKLISIHDYISNQIEEILENGEIKVKTIKTAIGLPINERNGTEISITLHKKSDKDKFIASIKKELAYFDNVYVYDDEIDNEYTIFNKDTFLYRLEGYSKEMHIVLGKVGYPIDWKVLDREPVNLPFGVKFNIGELQVTPNRENIIYNVSEDGDSDTKDIINKRIDACLVEVNSLLSKKGINETSDIFEYLEKRKAKPSIEFDEDTRVFVPKELITVDVGIIYTPLAHLNIKIPDNPFGFMQCYNELNGSKIDYRDYVRAALSTNTVKNKYDIHILDTPSDHYTNIVLSEKSNYVYFYSKLPFKKLYHIICKELEIYSYRKGGAYRDSISFYQFDKTKDYIKRENKKKLKLNQDCDIRQVVLGKPRIIKEYVNHIYSLIQDKFIYYSSLKPSEEWIEEYKRNIKENAAQYQRKINKEVIIVKDGIKNVVSLGHLQKFDSVVYVERFGNKIEHNELLNKIQQSLNSIYSLNKKDYWKQKIILIQISNTSLNILKELDNIIPANEFFISKIFDKYNQMYRDYHYLQSSMLCLNALCGVHWVNKTKRKELKKYTNRIEKSILVYKYIMPNKLVVVSKEAVELKVKIDKVLEKLEINKFIHSNIPKKLLIPIVSKLKSTFIAQEYLGLNPVQKINNVVELNNLLIF